MKISVSGSTSPVRGAETASPAMSSQVARGSREVVIPSPCRPGAALVQRISGADDPVDRLAQEVSVPVVPGVLQQHVDHHQPQRHVLVPACLVADYVE